MQKKEILFIFPDFSKFSNFSTVVFSVRKNYHYMEIALSAANLWGDLSDFIAVVSVSFSSR